MRYSIRLDDKEVQSNKMVTLLHLASILWPDWFNQSVYLRSKEDIEEYESTIDYPNVEDKK